MFSTLSQGEICILATFILSSANVFSLNQSKIVLFSKVLTLPNDKNSVSLKLKGFAEDTINCELKIEICFGKVRKPCGKRRKCWLPAFSPFPTMFSEGYFFRVVKSRECVVKSLFPFQSFTTQSCLLMTLRWRSFEKRGKRRKCLISLFSPFPQCFLSYQKDKSSFLQDLVSPFLTFFPTAIYIKCVKMRCCVVMG